MADEHENGGEDPSSRSSSQPEQLAGVWANEAQVGWSEHEFTIDFVRLDPFQPRGIVDTLRAVWHDWARKAMPPEIEGTNGEELPPDD
jgi:hypothetical protein